MDYWSIGINEVKGSWDYLFNSILNPSWDNYFYWLIGLSLFAYLLELIRPWRPNQSAIRKDFWLDAFYMFFNYFLFYVIGFAFFAKVSEVAIQNAIPSLGDNSITQWVGDLPWLSKLLLYFILVDFIHWNVHRLLHRVPILWEFHKVHHSVEEMGFAAHLRFHWMENVIYKSLQYFPLALIGGFDLEYVFLVHIIQTGIGHLNHANFVIPMGPLKYIFNSSEMHIWHHAHEIPEGKSGVNFGLSLSVWDYIFKTAHIPSDGKNIKLGFPGLASFPKRFTTQFVYPFWKKKG